MALIIKKFGGFHLRVYSSVNIATGVPLTGPRKQQSILLHREDEHFTTKNAPGVRALANLKEEEIKAWEAAALAGTVVPDGNMLVKDFLENIFMPHIVAHREAATAKSYRGYWNAYLAPHFNHTRTLKGYEAYMGTTFLAELCKQFSDATVDHARALASSIFKLAASLGYIKANPWREVSKIASGVDVEEGHAYTEREVEQILAALESVSGREDRSAELAGMVITICFYAGLRPSEAAGLKWENVDLTTSRIKIKNAFVAGSFKGTKNKKIRTLDILPQLQHRLRLWAMREGHPTQGWVFPNSDGNPVNINDLSSRIIAKTLKTIGLSWEGLYAMRRGFCTAMVNAGATYLQVADAAGNTPEMIQNHYYRDKDSTLAKEDCLDYIPE
jgi:integrase